MKQRAREQRKQEKRRGAHQRAQQAPRKEQHGTRAVNEEARRRPLPAVAQDQLLMGRNSLREVLRHAPDRLLKVFVAESRAEHTRAEREKLVSELEAHRVPIQRLRSDELSALVGSDSHQSFVAELRPRAQRELRSFLEEATERREGLLLMLDAVHDPQNVGALLRAAECFEADAVVLSRNRGAGLTPVARKASVGASELVEVLEVANLVEAARRCKDAGYWIVAADSGPESVALDAFSFPEKTLLILGSEGEGLQPLLRKQADFVVRIPLYGRIDSLNVSQAGAILLHAARRAIGGAPGAQQPAARG